MRTSVHVFVLRYRLDRGPWNRSLLGFDDHPDQLPDILRLLFCVMLVLPLLFITTYTFPAIPGSTVLTPGNMPLSFVDKNASTDNAPVIIRSDLPESDYVSMPVGDAAKDSALFAPLAYYKLRVPVVALPRKLNDEALRIGSQFLQDAAKRHERFLAVAFYPSYQTLGWIISKASPTYHVHELGVFDGIKVLEFTFRSQADVSR